MSALIAFRMLGPLEVTVEGNAPPPEALWRKHLGLTLYLVLNRARPTSREALLGLLWAESAEGAARHSLNEALRVIRQTYGREMIESAPDNIRWVGAVTLDLDEFTQHVDANALAAATLIRGPWCDGFTVPGAGGFEEWLATERDRWRGRLTATLSRAAGALADRGEVMEALQYADRACRLNPWDDEAVRTLMRVRTLMGDRVGAIAAGETHATRLATELDALPAAATRMLLTELREGRGVGERPDAAGVIHAHTPPLLRREGALERALGVWRSATASHSGVTICWLGAPGSGKSRLLQELVWRCRLEGARVTLCRAVPDDGATRDGALLAIADAVLDHLPGLGGADSDAIGTLAGRRPRWAERFPAIVPTRELAFHDALAAALIAASEEAVVIVAIDDIDRFHPESLAVLATLARAVQSHRVTLALTTTDVSESAALQEFLRLPGDALPGAVIGVPPLTLDHATALAHWAYPDWTEEAAARLARRLVVEAGESIFVAVELLSAIRAGLALPEAPPLWPPAERTLDATLPAEWPTTLRVALRHRWHQLGRHEQALLQWLSVGHEPCAEASMVESVPDPVTRLQVLDRMEATRWLTSDPRGYSFASRVTRRFVAEDTMTPGQRRRVEARVGG